MRRSNKPSLAAAEMPGRRTQSWGAGSEGQGSVPVRAPRRAPQAGARAVCEEGVHDDIHNAVHHDLRLAHGPCRPCDALVGRPGRWCGVCRRCQTTAAGATEWRRLVLTPCCAPASFRRNPHVLARAAGGWRFDRCAPFWTPGHRRRLSSAACPVPGMRPAAGGERRVVAAWLGVRGTRGISS